LWSTGDKRIRAYIDASYGIHHDRKSHAGLYLTLGGGPISVKSCKLRLVVKSSTVYEAELVAMSHMCSTVLWALEWLRELDYNVKSALVYQDNLNAMQLATNGDSSSGKSKHIEIRYY